MKRIILGLLFTISCMSLSNNDQYDAEFQALTAESRALAEFQKRVNSIVNDISLVDQNNKETVTKALLDLKLEIEAFEKRHGVNKVLDVTRYAIDTVSQCINEERHPFLQEKNTLISRLVDLKKESQHDMEQSTKKAREEFLRDYKSYNCTSFQSGSDSQCRLISEYFYERNKIIERQQSNIDAFEQLITELSELPTSPEIESENRGNRDLQ